MKHLFICGVLLATLGGAFLGCDSTTSPNNPLADIPSITGFKINPTSVEFSKDTDGFTDTTLTVHMTVKAKNIDDAVTPQFSIVDESSGELFAEGPFQFNPQNNEYTAEFNVSTNTTEFSTYKVHAFINNDEGKGNSAESTLTIRGFANERPVILETDSPGTITRPTDNSEIPATFTAKVTDADGQDNIEGVFLRVISSTSGEVEGSPFRMYDDGSTFGDAVANDSVFTWSLPVTKTNQNPNRDFNIEFFARDKGGLYSDTVKTTFKIRE